MNAWVAALLGFLVGGVLASLGALLLLVLSGMPMPWQSPEDLAADWSGVVSVATDGSVSGDVLSDAVLELGGGGFYVEADCPDTPKVGEDVTTVCTVDDGFGTLRVVVLFFDDLGTFETAEIYGN